MPMRSTDALPSRNNGRNAAVLSISAGRTKSVERPLAELLRCPP